MLLDATIKIEDLQAEGVELHEDVYKLWINDEIGDVKSIES